MSIRADSLEGTPRTVLAAGLIIAVVALIDWRVDLNVTFGFLYLFPILLVATVFSRWQILLTACFCTVLSDFFDPFHFSMAVSLPQDILVFSALAGGGLFSYEVTRSRRRELENLHRVERESAARREAEEQLAFLIDSSPAAILTMSGGGLIVLANAAAHRLLGVEPGRLPGRYIRDYVPALGFVPSIEDARQTFRTEMQCRGVRANGDVFLANVFFSTYRTAVGPRLAALIVDASEELRDREESSLEQLMAGSRILVGAVSHEVRNVCSAIGVIHENLVRGGTLNGNKDFEALGSLVEALNRIASLELRQTARESHAGSLNLADVLDDLRIVLEARCQEADIRVNWDVPHELPPVWADRHSLLQALLNLTNNSQRALQFASRKQIDISAVAGHGMVSIRVADTGPGIQSSENLFLPFQKGADATGLGLYLSRAFVRSFRGELRHDASAPGCCFVIELAVAGKDEADRGTYTTALVG